DPFGVHPADEHMAMIPVRGDDGILLLDIGVHADDDGFLADVEVAEAADEAHAVELPRLLLEAAYEQHVAVELEELGGGYLRALVFLGARLALGGSHPSSRKRRAAPDGAASVQSGSVACSGAARKATPGRATKLRSAAATAQ